MAKTLEFTTKSPRQIKQGDTETMFTFICKNAGAAVDLTQATNIIAKIGNYSGYLRSQPIDPTSLAGLNPGWINLQPTPALMAGLPAGSYQLEIWVVDQAGTSIYPSDAPLSFTITNNIENEGGDTITTITFDDFVEAMNKAASTIAKGDKGDDGLSAYQVAVINGYHGSQTDWLASLKGDTGTVDNTGLISAPAFQSLQSQVNNLHVGGRNYALNTSNPLTVKGTGASWQNFDTVMLSEDLQGKAVTLSFIISADATAIAGTGSIYGQYDKSYSPAWVAPTKSDWLIEGPTYSGIGIPVNILKANTPTRFVYRFTMPTGSSGIMGVPIWFKNVTGNITISQVLVTTNNVATDWSPNPAEILTQSDYAKIKAAIVALGGALS